jgi:UDP-glucose:(heptosyl)LPS alpha-1,3-glucosyltransferase
VKLALVRQNYTPFGGAERFVERALAALRRQGTDVTIIARNWQGEAGPGFLRCNPFYVGRTWRDAGFARCVRHLIAEDRFDLVQSHERIPGCHIYRAGDGVHATWLELRGRARGVSPWLTLALSALSPWHRYTLAAEAALYRHPNLKAVICNSLMVRDDITKRFPAAADKLHVIYNGVDLDHFHPGLRREHRTRLRAELGIGEDAPVILFVGSGFERKGIPALLNAFARAKRQDSRLLIVGRDRKEQAMRDLAARLGLTDRVRFLGGLKDVRPYYGTADCFALPTIYDPMPNAALEALACGVPVVTSISCGAAELIHPGINGHVCDALAVGDLARHLDALTDTRIAPEQVRATVAHLGIEEMAARLIGLYGASSA